MSSPPTPPQGTFIFDEPEPLIFVNTTGGITLSNSATRERLALWMVRHQRDEHEERPFSRAEVLGLTGILVVLLVCAWFGWNRAPKPPALGRRE